MKAHLKPAEIKVPGSDKPVLAKLEYPPGSGRFLPEEGAPRSMLGKEGGFWRRRLAEGAVVVVEDAAKDPAKPSRKTKAKEQ